jgi:hypothetical protein
MDAIVSMRVVIPRACFSAASVSRVASPSQAKSAWLVMMR